MLAVYAECYNALIPQLESDVSLANFIVELKDFKGLVKYFGRGVDTIMKVADDVRWRAPRVARPVKRRHESDADFQRRLVDWRRDRKFYMLDTASSLDLTYHYAVRPFVNDVAAMSTMWGGLIVAIQKMNHQGSVRNVRHGFREVDPVHSVTGSTQSRLVTSKRSVYRLTAEMTYRLKPMSQLDAFMGWSGLRVNPKKLWDMVPFSFVVDHFCTMGEALGSFDRSEVDFDMTRLLESIKSECALVNTYHPTYQAYTYFSGGGAGDAAELFDSSPYATYHPLAWVYRQSYVRQGIDVPYVRPFILPRLQIPGCDAIRLDLDLLYQTFFRGRNKPSWRSD
jgi:hypothetical protein